MTRQAFSNGVIDLNQLSSTQGLTIQGKAMNDYSGNSVSRAGDVNNDGIDDVIVGAYGASPAGRTFAGESYVIFGKAELSGTLDLAVLNATQGLVIQGRWAYDYSGVSVSGAGDVNNDGVDDVIVGVHEADPAGRVDAGESLVIFGGTGLGGILDLATFSATQGLTIQGKAIRDYSGSSVSGAGDVNGDGVDDVIVGAPQANPLGRGDAGEGYVIFGRSGLGGTLDLATFNATQGLFIQGKAMGDASGRSVSAAGDVNGDGMNDVIVGANQAAPFGRSNAGESILIFGRVSLNGTLDLAGPMATQGLTLQGKAVEDYSGRSVSAAGDVNDDGMDDVIVGAHGANPLGRNNAGESYVIFGGMGLGGTLDLAMFNATQGVVIQGKAVNDYSGFSVSAAGDVNGDGVDDVIVGAPYGRFQAGESYVIFGRSGLRGTLDLASLTATQGLVIRGKGGSSGYSVSAAGDVNGDGVDDVIVGAYQATSAGRSGAGESYLIFGNVAPQWVNNRLDITEGARVNVTTTDIFASDQNHLPSVLVITPSLLSQGQFEQLTNPGIALANFTQAEVNAGNIQFVHDGSEISPTYALTVSDGIGFHGPLNATITFNNNVNDIPVLGNNTLTINEGETKILTALNLSASDVDNDPANLIFLVSSVQQGQFELTTTPGVMSNFTQQQVSDSLVRFVHDGGEVAPSYQVSVSDGSLSTLPVNATITFNNINDAPVLGNNSLTINEGEVKVLSASNLSASDLDNDSANLTFLVSQVQQGQFELANNSGVAITSFIQQKISDNAVRFVHNGGELAPSYQVSVSDANAITLPVNATITFNNNVNDAPVLGNNTLTINEGETKVLTASNLSASDVDNDEASLTFMLSQVQQGQFELTTTLGAMSNFTQQQISDSLVQFVHDGGEVAPSYQVSVSDGSLSTAPANATIIFGNLNDAPVLINNSLTINEGETKVLTGSDLSASDVDNAVNSLQFIVSNVQQGRFDLVNDPGTAITSSIQQQISNGLVQFVHDGGEVAPSYRVSVSDGSLSTSSVNVTITFNNNINDPPMLVNNAFSFTEGGTTIITPSMLSATDSDNNEADLIFTVSGVQQGQFEVISNPGIPITSFTQQQISDNTVRFVHDGGEVAPSYQISVSDGSLSTSPVNANISFSSVNDPPILAKPILDRTVTVGQSFQFNLGGTFSDLDQDTLTLSAQLIEGSPLPSWMQFDAGQEELTGTAPQAESITIQLTARDAGNLTISDDFSLTASALETDKSATDSRNSESSNSGPSTQTTIRNSAIGAGVAGFIGLGFFAGKRWYQKHEEKKKIDEKLAIKVGEFGEAAKQRIEFRQYFVTPFAKVLAQRLNIQGGHDLNSDDGKRYLGVMENVFSEIRKKELVVDKLSEIAQVKLLDAFSEAVKQNVPLRRSWGFWQEYKTFDLLEQKDAIVLEVMTRMGVSQTNREIELGDMTAGTDSGASATPHFVGVTPV